MISLNGSQVVILVAIRAFKPEHGKFILKLFELSELSQHAVHLIRMARFDLECCNHLSDLAPSCSISS